VKHRGLTVYLRGDWVERAMLAAKCHTRGKVSSKVEIVALQLDLDERALQHVALELGLEFDGDAEADGAAAAPLVYSTGTRSSLRGNLATNGSVRDAGHAILVHEWARMQVRRQGLLLGWCWWSLRKSRRAPPLKPHPTPEIHRMS
jgi:hypothetical protein